MDSLKRVELKLNNVTLLGRKLNNSWLSFQQSNTQWLGKFNTSIATGQVVIPHNRNKTVSLKLDSLSINPADNLSMKPATKHKSTKLINTQQWPKVELLIEQLTLNKLNIGQWSAFLAPTISGYKASDIRGKIATTNISGEVGWAKQKSEVRSFFDVQAKGGDFGFALKQLGYAQVLENKSGDLDAKLSWSGYPWDFEQGNLNGRASFKLLKGRIIEAGTSANFLRIFGILNLNSVIKRLQLDFSDLLKSGVAFDSVTGKYSLQNGVATSQEPLKLQGDAASIEMAGSINLSQQTLDQKMIVAIPLSSNAPIAALLLATPQVAGIAFVVDKLIGKRLAKLTALRYSVSGSWFEPTIQTVTVANTGGSEPEPTNNN
jgi:uncharacterized protein YhdP